MFRQGRSSQSLAWKCDPDALSFPLQDCERHGTFGSDDYDIVHAAITAEELLSHNEIKVYGIDYEDLSAREEWPELDDCAANREIVFKLFGQAALPRRDPDDLVGSGFPCVGPAHLRPRRFPRQTVV